MVRTNSRASTGIYPAFIITVTVWILELLKQRHKVLFGFGSVFKAPEVKSDVPEPEIAHTERHVKQYKREKRPTRRVPVPMI